ncbi:ribonucleotide-diphosphate reductase subunit beta [Bradyrhizobium sp. USDA 10063]
MPKSEFEAFRGYAEMRAKADYMRQFGVDTVADVARTLAMFGAFTEGMALFASFAMLLNFPRHNKMNGMGQIVSWSVRDESLHCEGVIKLFHEWHRETGAVTRSVRDDIVDVAKTMVKLEENFVDLAFGLGKIEGMRPEQIHAYVRYVADWRLTQLRIAPIFGFFEAKEGRFNQLKAHPLPWLVEILNGVEHANFFEQRATEYSRRRAAGAGTAKTGCGRLSAACRQPEQQLVRPLMVTSRTFAEVRSAAVLPGVQRTSSGMIHAARSYDGVDAPSAAASHRSFPMRPTHRAGANRGRSTRLP